LEIIFCVLIFSYTPRTFRNIQVVNMLKCKKTKNCILSLSQTKNTCTDILHTQARAQNKGFFFRSAFFHECNRAPSIIFVY